MKLELATWPDGTTVKEFDEDPEALDLPGDMSRLEAPMHVELTVSKHVNEVVVEGRLEAPVLATCVRCLEEFPFPVHEDFRRIGSIVPDKEVNEDTGDPDYVLVPQSLPEWDLNQVFREIIALAVPESPICREGCLGICPQCGANRNEDPCDCRIGDDHGPLAQLSNLIEARSEDPDSDPES